MNVFLLGIGLILGFVGLWIALQRRLMSVQRQFSESLKALSFEVMEKNNRSFLDLAAASLDGRHKAIETALNRLDEQQRELERRREGAYAALSKQLEGMVLLEKELRQETAHLVQVLRAPQTRGAWGEIHLRRVVELAGLLNHCDFLEQKNLDAEGKIWRPDLIVHLPGQRQIAIDAKAPLTAYLDALDAKEEAVRKTRLQDHALCLKKHIKDLSLKEYWKQLPLAPEYVVLFLPAEAFFSSALQADPSLIEVGADQNIIIATPTTLIAILRAIAFSWKQEGLSKNAQEISRLGHDLYDRLGTVCEHWNKVGKNLNLAVEAYNQGISSLESRVLVSARKLKENCSILKEIDEPQKVERLARSSQKLSIDKTK